ncbi:MAG TPA: hypothetical protein VNE21_02425 [Mycobacteriales bacterium]|nr:hypothetical protein [Mycobacteriales bacterium]
MTWRLVLVPGAAKVAFQLATVNLYGPHRDEFSYLVSGQHPAWGYVDNPPLVPWLYRLQELAFGHSMGALAVVPALLGGVLVVLAAVMISDRRSRVLGLERRWR